MDTKKLRQKILDLAIRGKLVPQDPNDEPASVLLERIRAEKERLIKEGKIKRSKKSTSDTPHYENVPFEVPESWEWLNVESFTYDLQYGTSEKSSNEGDIPVLRMGNITRIGTIDFADLVYSSNKDDISKYALLKDDLLFNRTNSSEWVGKTAIFKSDLPAIYAGYLIRVRCILVCPDYINFVLNSSYHRDWCNSVKTDAVNQSNINAQKLSKHLIPIPPYEEQLRIVAETKIWMNVIDKLDCDVSEFEQVISKIKSKILDLAIHGKLVLQDPNDEPAIELLKRINPKFTPCDNAHCLYGFPISWELAKLEDVCEFIRNGVSIRQIKGANGIPITRIETISNGVVEREKMGYADIEDDTYEKYYLQNGDILMSHINSPIHVGKSALYESIDGEKIIHGMNLLCLRMKDGIYPKYMNHLFKSDFFRDKIRPYIKNAVNQASINTRSLGGVYTPIPSHKEQLRIVTKIEELFAVLDEIQKSIED